ncbi:MAG: GNAT family N-acetyltransferase [Gammaproteobacteria bacterium]|nr:GNAT family N-acetyltransferase [Gammaproteobacteria bacterium]MBU1646621.1 GNAT family N-acetyltransferase [Gammaproteobacteria bacterium]MBU1972878.1 GNAT family N-acetyltransferase [Gammaproteobacteria bacterium]
MRIRISIPAQMLELHDDDGRLLRRYAVSTARNGGGEQNGSYMTPRGRHLIRAKVGAGATANAVFVRRRPTGEVWSPELAAANPGRDWILTRIMWLSGREPGRNRLGDVDTMRRYIYLHGSPDNVAMGEPGSIGCVRMRNADIVELFDLVPAYTAVDIVEFRIEEGGWESLAAAAQPVREVVFVEEQGVSRELEWDEFDSASRHVVAFDADGQAIGTGRLLPDGHIGRMAVVSAWRGQGVGRALLERLIEAAGASGRHEVLLHAQSRAAGFYRRFGFIATGDEFMEAGIPHVRMERRLI